MCECGQTVRRVEADVSRTLRVARTLSSQGAAAMLGESERVCLWPAASSHAH